MNHRTPTQAFDLARVDPDNAAFLADMLRGVCNGVAPIVGQRGDRQARESLSTLRGMIDALAVRAGNTGDHT